MDDDQCVLIFRILEDLTDADAAAIKGNLVKRMTSFPIHSAAAQTPLYR